MVLGGIQRRDEVKSLIRSTSARDEGHGWAVAVRTRSHSFTYAMRTSPDNSDGDDGLRLVVRQERSCNAPTSRLAHV